MGHAIGRLGCFAAGCCWGKTTHAALGRHVPQSRRLGADRSAAGDAPASLPALRVRHRSSAVRFLYWRFGRKHEPGQIIGLYLVLSSVARFLIEFTRFHEQALPFGLPLVHHPMDRHRHWRWPARLCWCAPDAPPRFPDARSRLAAQPGRTDFGRTSGLTSDDMRVRRK